MAADTLTDTSGAAQCDLDQSAQAGPTHPKRTKHGSPGHLRATSQPGCHQSVSRGGWTSRNPLLSTAPGAGLELGRASGEEPGFWFLSRCVRAFPREENKMQCQETSLSVPSHGRDLGQQVGWLLSQHLRHQPGHVVALGPCRGTVQPAEPGPMELQGAVSVLIRTPHC